MTLKNFTLFVGNRNVESKLFVLNWFLIEAQTISLKVCDSCVMNDILCSF